MLTVLTMGIQSFLARNGGRNQQNLRKVAKILTPMQSINLGK